MLIGRVFKSKSISSRVKYSFIVIIILICLGFVFSIYVRDVILSKNDKNMNIDIRLSKLSVEFSNSWSYFDLYTQTKSQEHFDKYTESNQKIESIMDEIEPYVDRDVDSSIYLRNLRNMFKVYKQDSSDIISKNMIDEKSYEKLINLKTLLVYINKHSELLTVSYLNYSNDQYTNIVKGYKNTEVQIYVLIMLIIIISFSYALSLSRDIRNTIGKLRKYAELLSNAQWEIDDIKDQKYEELNSLAKTFNKMKNSIRQFIQELNEKAEIESNYHKEKLKSAEKDKLIKETQLLALQSQMDPHFLFNTLNTISRMAMFEDANNTVELIEATSKILRYNLAYKDKLVKLRDEISMMRAYVTIQQTRFQDQMVFNFDIDEELESIVIPPMIIQPLIENAIIHGLREKGSGGIIDIIVKRESEYAAIKVKDNGKGIEDEIVRKILKGEEHISESRNSTGIGLSNMVNRIGLFFNRNDLIDIDSKVGVGTEITILIPIERSL